MPSQASNLPPILAIDHMLPPQFGLLYLASRISRHLVEYDTPRSLEPGHVLLAEPVHLRLSEALPRFGINDGDRYFT